MLTGNKLFKLNSSAEVERITTDDIPEGKYNKYSLSYADGKLIGDIILRPSPEEVACHSLLNGQIIYEFNHKDFYKLCLDYKNLAKTDEDYANFNKTMAQYTEFLSNNIWEETQEAYCPYFVLGSETKTVYEVSKDNAIGYTNLYGEKDIEVPSGYIYDDKQLSNTISDCEDWYFTGKSFTSNYNFVKLPTMPSYLSGNTKMYYFIVTNSRVDDDTSSIRSVRVGTTYTLDPHDTAYVRNVGTLQNLVLDFGIPNGKIATIKIGEVKSGIKPEVINTGNEEDAILNFTFPRGEQGIAGGVIVLKAIVNSLPNSSNNIEDKYYLTTENAVYYYDGGWKKYQDADSGLIYLADQAIYYYNGNKLLSAYGMSKVDSVTLKVNSAGVLENVATKNVQGKVMYDWVGTLNEWEKGRANGSIPDSYICFVTDD